MHSYQKNYGESRHFIYMILPVHDTINYTEFRQIIQNFGVNLPVQREAVCPVARNWLQLVIIISRKFSNSRLWG